jgi:hypothetical protein
VTVPTVIVRQVGEHEAEGERLHEATSNLAEQANENTALLAGAVRQAIEKARQSFDATATHAELREAVERWDGPMVLRPDGTIAQKQSAAEVAADVKGVLAGARYLPLHATRDAFWRRFGFAALPLTQTLKYKGLSFSVSAGRDAKRINLSPSDRQSSLRGR